MKINILDVLHQEYPDFLNTKDDFVLDNMKEFQNSEVHLKNMDKLIQKDNHYIENILLKEIVNLVLEVGYDTSCEYFSAITNRFTANVRDGQDRVIIVDDLLKSGLIEFYVLVLSWADKFNDIDAFEYCFINILYLLDMRCTKKVLGTVNPEKDKKWFRSLKENILEIASNCYWVSWCFMVLHEIGHLVLGHTKISNNETHEYDADKFAYDIILKLIEKHHESKDEFLSIFKEYTCFSPMMLLDFYRVIDVFQSSIYPDQKQIFIPDLQTRIDKLIDMGIDTFDISEGNTVYKNYLDVLDYFIEQFLLKHKRGKLDILPNIKAD